MTDLNNKQWMIWKLLSQSDHGLIYEGIQGDHPLWGGGENLVPLYFSEGESVVKMIGFSSLSLEPYFNQEKP